MSVERRLIQEIRPRNERNRHLVRVHDILDADTGKFINWNCSIISQKKDDTGKILDEWFINIHPREIDELVSMLLEAKKAGVGRLMELAEEPEEEKGDDDGNGGGPREVGARAPGEG